MNTKLSKDFDENYEINDHKGYRYCAVGLKNGLEIKQFIDKNFIAKEEDMTNQAIAQFTGYIEAKNGFPIENLVESMGLTKKEFIKIERDLEFLGKDLLQDIKNKLNI